MKKIGIWLILILGIVLVSLGVFKKTDSNVVTNTTSSVVIDSVSEENQSSTCTLSVDLPAHSAVFVSKPANTLVSVLSTNNFSLRGVDTDGSVASATSNPQTTFNYGDTCRVEAGVHIGLYSLSSCKVYVNDVLVTNFVTAWCDGANCWCCAFDVEFTEDIEIRVEATEVTS